MVRLLAGLFASMLLGVIIVSGYESLASEAGRKHRDLFLFVVGVFSFHGVGLVLVNVFLRQHNLTWGQAFGFNQPGLPRAIFLSVVLAVVMLPIALSLTEVSERLLRQIHVPVEPQQAVRMMQDTTSRMDLLFHGVAAILLAPFVEE